MHNHNQTYHQQLLLVHTRAVTLLKGVPYWLDQPLVKISNICTTLIFIADISHHRHHQRSCFGLLYPILAILACICVYYIFGVLFTSLFGVPKLTNIIFCKT